MPSWFVVVVLIGLTGCVTEAPSTEPDTAMTRVKPAPHEDETSEPTQGRVARLDHAPIIEAQVSGSPVRQVNITHEFELRPGSVNEETERPTVRLAARLDPREDDRRVFFTWTIADVTDGDPGDIVAQTRAQTTSWTPHRGGLFKITLEAVEPDGVVGRTEQILPVAVRGVFNSWDSPDKPYGSCAEDDAGPWCLEFSVPTFPDGTVTLNWTVRTGGGVYGVVSYIGAEVCLRGSATAWSGDEVHQFEGSFGEPVLLQPPHPYVPHTTHGLFQTAGGTATLQFGADAHMCYGEGAWLSQPSSAAGDS